MEVVSAFAGKIVDCLLDATGRHLGYLFHYNSNIETFKKQFKKLAGARERVQGEIDAANRRGETIIGDVQDWIAEANKQIEESETFLIAQDNANKSCLKGWCINLKQHYKFSKEAKQRTLVISQLQEGGKFDTVSHPVPPSRMIYSSERFSGTFESRKVITEQVMVALNDDNVNIVGICGMGGVGKTTLVKDISKQVMESKLYDIVVMAVVSQTPSILKIQGEIAHMLGLTTLPDNFESARAHSLWERIKTEKRILVILDDVWERIEMDKIGIPLGKDHRGCKIVLTSRSRDVCNEMDAQKISAIQTLSEEESWVLFREIAGPDVDNYDINPIARDVAAECGGLPIAIVTIARALKNKNSHVWHDVARQLKASTPTDIKGMQGSVISSLELSFKYLESEDAKLLFLFCSLFPEDFRIQVEVLVRYGVGLRWFKNVETMVEVRHRAHAVVSTLISSFLLIHEKNDMDDEDYVKMHDVVRDVAHIIAPKYNQIFMVKAGIVLQEWPSRDTFEDLTGISLMSNDIKKLPDGLKCPKLHTLLLQKTEYKLNELVVPHTFFQGMKDLRVLDLSGTQLLPLAESLSLLVNIRTLYLNHCILGDLSRIGQLRNLEILSLSGSDITEIPITFNQLSHLRLMDLNRCKKLTRISYGIISSLCNLEELYIIKSFRNWDFEEGDLINAKLAELQYLSRLSSLEIYIPNLNFLPNSDMPFKNLTSFTLILGVPKHDLLKEFVENKKYSRTVMISYHEVLVSQLLDCIQNLVTERTEQLFISGLENIFCDLVNRGFSELKALTVCFHEMTYLPNTLELASNLSFHNLEELKISKYPKLIEICHGQPPAQFFSKLKLLVVEKCDMLSNIDPSLLLERFQNLEVVEVKKCKSVVYIFDCEELNIANGETKLLSSLKALHLSFLPEMWHIWNNDTQFVNLCNLKRVNLEGCPKLIKLFSPALLQSLICLEELSIVDCSSLEEIFGKKEEEDQEKGIVAWRKDHTTTSPSLGNLTSLEIYRCCKLKTLFTSSMAESLVKLRKLSLYSISTVQEIITNEEGEKEASIVTIVFPSLFSLELQDLENITCFSSGSYSIEFPALETLCIDGCPNMKTFGYGDQLTPKLNKVLSTHKDHRIDYFWMGNLNATVQHLFKEQEMRKNEGQDANHPGESSENTATET